jgi:hypothetical protein
MPSISPTCLAIDKLLSPFKTGGVSVSWVNLFNALGSSSTSAKSALSCSLMCAFHFLKEYVQNSRLLSIICCEYLLSFLTCIALAD